MPEIFAADKSFLIRAAKKYKRTVRFVILLASVLFFIFPFEHAQFIFNARTFNYKITHA